MSPAVPFHPGTPTTIARGSPCAGPHVRNIIWRPSDARQLGGPSLHIAGPSRCTTGSSCCAHDATARPIASANIRAVARRIELRLLSAFPPSLPFSRKVFTQLGHFLQKRALSTRLGRKVFHRTERPSLARRWFMTRKAIRLSCGYRVGFPGACSRRFRNHKLKGAPTRRQMVCIHCCLPLQVVVE
jgi:hypothetical protein